MKIKGNRRPVRMNKDLPGKFKYLKGAHRRWKWGQVTWKKYRDTVKAQRNELRKAKIYLELNLARHTKGRSKGTFTQITSKRKTGQNVGLLLSGEGDLVMRTQERLSRCLVHLSAQDQPS